MSDSDNGEFDPQEGFALRRGVLPPLLGVQDITDISEFFVSQKRNKSRVSPVIFPIQHFPPRLSCLTALSSF